MFRESRHSTARWLSLSLGVIVLATGALLLVASPVPAKPPVAWAPESVSEILLPGESDAVAVFWTASQEVSDARVEVVPELEAFVQVSPVDLGDVNEGDEVTLTLQLSVPVEAVPGLIEGTIQVKSANTPKRVFARPLPVTIEIWQTVTEATSGVTLAFPPNLESFSVEDTILVREPMAEELEPWLFTAFVIDLSPDIWDELDALSAAEAHERIARDHLGSPGLDVIGFDDAGLEVRAATLQGHHFIVYERSSRRAIEFGSHDPDTFGSAEFREMLRRIDFGREVP